MKRTAFLITFISFLVFPSIVSASVVKITKEGEVVSQILGAHDEISLSIPQNDDLSIVNIAGGSADPKASVFIAKADFGTNVNISNGRKNESYQIEGDKDLVEIEERAEKERVLISSQGRSFLIRQKGFTAETSYEIQVDPTSAHVSLQAPSGLRYLAVLPREALDTLLKAKIINKFNALTSAKISENTENDLVYEIAGAKALTFFNIYTHSVPVTTTISATTGEIVDIDQPFWLPLVGTLFS